MNGYSVSLILLVLSPATDFFNEKLFEHSKNPQPNWTNCRKLFGCLETLRFVFFFVPFWEWRKQFSCYLFGACPIIIHVFFIHSQFIFQLYIIITIHDKWERQRHFFRSLLHFVQFGILLFFGHTRTHIASKITGIVQEPYPCTFEFENFKETHNYAQEVHTWMDMTRAQ